MQKQDAVASLGQGSLLKPARLRAALRANDRLKLYLTVLQAAAGHARAPATTPPDLGREIAAAGFEAAVDADWLHDLPATCAWHDGAYQLAELPALAARLHDDLALMARPVQDDGAIEFDPRLAHWLQQLAALQGPRLDEAQLAALTHGRRGEADSLHLLVMDLHKALNRLAARLAGEEVDGAHVWGLAEAPAAHALDRARIAAFMRGLARTRALKLDHPGLDTAATRDGERLLIQNDIGTNDAHVLVLQLEAEAFPATLTLTYSDLHRSRFAFFQQLLAPLGAQWTTVDARRSAGLNQGEAYTVGTARFAAADEAALQAVLEGVAARIVFLIDWNRARKKLQAFVDKAGAVAVLAEAARREAGHMAWLAAGGERLLWQAMAGQGPAAFRLGDRLDEVMGEEAARELLVEVLVLAAQAAARRQPIALVADEVRLLLARRLHGRRSEFELLLEHAGLCHALAQGLRDALAHGLHRDAAAAQHFAARAKTWERQADHLVMQAREQAARQPQWQPLARLVERSDDVADALEEAAFVLSLVADGHHEGWGAATGETMQALADAVLGATQDHVKALAVAQTLGERSEAADHDEFVAATWRVLQAERRCDELLRSARRALAREVGDAASLQLGNELAAALEQASDALLALVYGLRERSFERVEAAA